LDAVSRTYQKHKIAGVRANITRSAIERLREQESDGVLTIEILEGKVAQVRALPTGVKSQNKTISLLSAKDKGSRNGTNQHSITSSDQGCSGKVGGGDDKDPLCERIRELSAVQPGQLIRLDVLDRYITYLNRHPGRQVDVALAPGPQEGELTLDYLLSEIKQPMFYAQISNTGTEQTSRCREQFGMIHHNLTRSDDILYVDYLTGNFDSVQGISGGYERPLGDWVTGDDISKRKDYHDWTWGDWTRVRAKVFGSWREYEASEVGLSRQTFRGESYSIGGELAWNCFQHRAFFLDTVAGFQHSRVKVDNDLTGREGKSDFLLPYFGFRTAQQSEKVNVNASLIAEFNLPEAAGTDDKGLLALDRLGRVNTDRNWLTCRYALDTSFFLEPILDKHWRDPEHHSTLAHELFSSARGQVTPNNRRVPANYMQTTGGFYTVRGYPESFSAGDSALMGTVEYRFHWPRSLKPREEPVKILGKSFRFQPGYELGRPDWDLILRSFFDFGHTHKNDKTNYERNVTLISSGLGVELSLRNNIKIRTDWGWPLKSADNGEDHVSVGNCRVHMSLSLIF
jgi:hemolysin activation/secretion protein